MGGRDVFYFLPAVSVVVRTIETSIGGNQERGSAQERHVVVIYMRIRYIAHRRRPYISVQGAVGIYTQSPQIIGIEWIDKYFAKIPGKVSLKTLYVNRIRIHRLPCLSTVECFVKSVKIEGAVCVHSNEMIGVFCINRQSCATFIVFREAISEFSPAGAAVGRFPDAGVLAAHKALIIIPDTVPGGSVEGVWVIGRHDQINNPCLVGDEQHLLPGLPAIGCFVEAPVGVFFKWDAHCSGVQDF